MSTNFLFWAFNVLSLATLIILIQMVRKETPSQVRFLVLFAVVGGAVWYYFSERSEVYQNVSSARLSHALQENGPIELAAVWDKQDGFFRGVELAVAQINQEGGVEVKGELTAKRRSIDLVKYIEDGVVGNGLGVQYEVARREQTVAVVGHRDANTAIPAALTYENNRLFYLVSSATDPKLTSLGFFNVVRSIPDDHLLSTALVNYCRSRGMKRIALLYARDSYGFRFATFFRDSLREQNRRIKLEDDTIAITLMRSYSAGEQDFSALVSELSAVKYDAIFIADAAPRAGLLIKDIRRRGIEVPILGGEGMATPQLWSAADKQARNVVVVSSMPALTEGSPQGRFADFAKSYSDRYNTPPDHWASQGYESVRILAQAWERAGTTLPRAVGSVLREYRDWQGLYGTYGFTARGDVINRPVYLKVMTDGHFLPISDSVGREVLKEEP